jgi:alcohol dehydrogenase (cytochrome c)
VKQQLMATTRVASTFGLDLRMSYHATPIVHDGILFVQSGTDTIQALDAASGRETWRFHTVARPGQPGGDSWNGPPVEKRSGALVWTPGSYDPDLDLVFFGAGNSYDTAPFRTKSAPDASTDLL